MRQNHTHISKIGLAGAVAILLLSACTSTPERPEWIDGQSAKFKSAFYIVGRGSGDSDESAKNQARADLAKAIEVKVDSQTQDSQEFSQSTVGGQTTSQTSMKIRRDVRTDVSRTIQGITISETWKDQKTGRYHALATLNRNQSAERLTDEIRELDKVTAALAQKAADEKDALAKTGYIGKALKSQYQRADLNRTLRIIQSSGEGIDSKVNVGTLVASLNDTAKSVQIKTVVPAETSDQMPAILGGAVAQAGFSVSDNGQFTLEAVVSSQDLELKQGWYWARGYVEVRLKDAKGNIRGTERWNIKTSATDQENAKQRFYNDINDELKKNLGDALIGFALKS